MSKGHVVPKPLALALVCIAVTAAAAAAPPDPPPSAAPIITIPRVSQPPKIDDFLSGDGTLGEASLSDFRQREPGDGEPASQPTSAYVSYDDRNLYVVFVCKDSDPSRIRARRSKRETIFGDDWVMVTLDTFHDHQRAYMFMANPLGIQGEGITTEGQGDDFNFDTLWHSEGRLTPDGYVVWMAIPFRSLRFPATDGQSWGLALGRNIPRNNESSWWPRITNRIEGFSNQFATADGLKGVSPGRNMQLIPYGAFAGARFLDESRADYATKTEPRGGLDAKLVVRDALTVDLALNPDFSQVESDEPQVTVNQRFEVFFPEKRPFFIENAGLFQTPGETLFFSRRVADPQFGARVTGKAGRWTIGGLAIDDRAPGHRVDPLDPAFDARTAVGVVRVQREFGQQSNVGFMATSRDFGSSSNRTGGIDTRLKLNKNWVFSGQAVATTTTLLDGTQLSGPAFTAGVSRSSRPLFYSLSYQDRSPDYRAQLGFVPRTDIRDVTQFITYRWRPKNSAVVAFGPNSYLEANWNRAGDVQDWIVRFPFEIDLKGQSTIFVRREERYELFDGFGFREHENLVNGGTSWLKWLSIYGSYAKTLRPNFFPAPGVAPFAADGTDVFVNFIVRPQPSLKIEEIYLYSSLTTNRPVVGTTVGAGARIFDDHIMRTRVDYQFTREWSLRGIIDYNGVLANPALVSLDRTKRFSADILATYLLNPGTALYIGYTDGYENLAFERGVTDSLRRAGSPTTSTGRQFFVKTSYLLRF